MKPAFLLAALLAVLIVGIAGWMVYATMPAPAPAPPANTTTG